MRLGKKSLWWVSLGFVAVLLVGTFAVTNYFTTTLPTVSGELRAEVSDRVLLKYDTLGVPTIEGASLLDVLQGQGYATARDRLFQMDLIRRRTLGQLSEILGPALIPSDRTRLTYGLGAVAEEAVAGMAPPLRARLEAFAKGVNLFITKGPLPPEMKLIGYRPRPWRPEDSVAVALSMFDPPDLKFEAVYTALTDQFPREIVDWVTTDRGFLDREMLGAAAPVLGLPAGNFSLRALGPVEPGLSEGKGPRDGSNAWAVAGPSTESGGSLLAGDPHLSLSVPNIWYRVMLKTPEFWVVGASLPGIPGVVIGTNGKVAWTFTNPSADLADRVPLEGVTESHYLVDGTPTAFESRDEILRIKGQQEQLIKVRETIWGPVVEENTALQWVALNPDPLSKLDVLGLGQSQDIGQAMQALENWAGPAHNAVLADAKQVAWVLVGKFPRRPFDGSLSQHRSRDKNWNGYFAPSLLPRVVKKEGWVVNSNQRPLWGSGGRRLASKAPTHRDLGRNWPVDGRAARISSLLGEVSPNLEGMKQIQLDLTSPTHRYYQQLLLEVPNWNTPWGKAIQGLARSWDGKLDVDSHQYPFLKEFRKQMQVTLFAPLVAELPKHLREEAVKQLDRDAVIQVLWDKRPIDWLPQPYSSYDELTRVVAEKTARRMANSPEKLGTTSWGEVNASQIHHPFNAILPGALKGWVNMRPAPLPGDVYAPRAAKPDHSASLRFIVDLGNVERSVYSQPTGQSGHFLSDHYRDQHEDWLNGRYSPLLPGSSVATLVLNSKGSK